MKDLFLRLAAVTTLALGLGVAAQSLAQDRATSLVAATRFFELHSDFEVNLHDALLEAGRTQWSDQPELFHSGEESACFVELPRVLRSAWDNAVAFYGETVSPPRARTAQFVIRLGLIGKEAKEAEDRQLAAIAAHSRSAAAPAYRACRWPSQDRANRAWVERLVPLLEAHEETIATRLAELYDKPLGGLPMRTDVVETVSWSSANTIWLTPEGGHIWVRNSAGEGPVALETVFHEASHTLVSPGSPLPEALSAAAETLGVEAPRDLWHGALFYMTGDVVRQVLEEAGEGGYVPMTFDQGIFSEYHEVLLAHWTAYLEGKTTMAEASRDLVRAAATGR